MAVVLMLDPPLLVLVDDFIYPCTELIALRCIEIADVGSLLGQLEYLLHAVVGTLLAHDTFGHEPIELLMCPLPGIPGFPWRGFGLVRFIG